MAPQSSALSSRAGEGTQEPLPYWGQLRGGQELLQLLQLLLLLLQKVSLLLREAAAVQREGGEDSGMLCPHSSSSRPPLDVDMETGARELRCLCCTGPVERHKLDGDISQEGKPEWGRAGG